MGSQGVAGSIAANRTGELVRIITLDAVPVAVTTVSVVIPSLNEAANIGWVLDRIPASVTEVILVDGRSTDETIAVARRHRPTIVVVEESAPGKGAALRAGFAAATGEYIVMLDADGSMDPHEIERFVDALAEGHELVKGSRFDADGGSDDITFMRRFGNGLFVRMANVMFGARLTDLCYGYIGFRRSRLASLRLDATGFEIETQIVTHALRAGLKVGEVPSFERDRLNGRSNLRPVRDGMRVLRMLLRTWRNRHQTGGDVVAPAWTSPEPSLSPSEGI